MVDLFDIYLYSLNFFDLYYFKIILVNRSIFFYFYFLFIYLFIYLFFANGRLPHFNSHLHSGVVLPVCTCICILQYIHFEILWILYVDLNSWQDINADGRCFHLSLKKVKETFMECHNHKPQPFPDTKRKRKQKKPNKRKSNKRTKSTNISFLFPKRCNRNAKRTAIHKNKITQGKAYVVLYSLNFLIYMCYFCYFVNRYDVRKLPVRKRVRDYESTCKI